MKLQSKKLNCFPPHIRFVFFVYSWKFNSFDSPRKERKWQIIILIESTINLSAWEYRILEIARKYTNKNRKKIAWNSKNEKPFSQQGAGKWKNEAFYWTIFNLTQWDSGATKKKKTKSSKNVLIENASFRFLFLGENVFTIFGGTPESSKNTLWFAE